MLGVVNFYITLINHSRSNESGQLIDFIAVQSCGELIIHTIVLGLVYDFDGIKTVELKSNVGIINSISLIILRIVTGVFAVNSNVLVAVSFACGIRSVQCAVYRLINSYLCANRNTVKLNKFALVDIPETACAERMRFIIQAGFVSQALSAK